MLMRKKTKLFLPLLIILILVPWPIAYAQSFNNDTTVRDADQVALVGSSITLGDTSTQEPARDNASLIPDIGGHAGSNPHEGFPFRLYVTPEDQVIKALAARINGAVDAYEVAVQWVYVSDQKLNHTDDRYLTPHQFLTNTPLYQSNPLKGAEVSDCEEQAHTLASLIRAEGIQPAEIRVALGEAEFGDAATGHAWVELLTDGHWIALDPSWGPYWDDKAAKLIHRQGVPFDYYASHTYPVLQVWAYYNDTYYLNPRDGSGNAPASWFKVNLAE
jgi:transglutaminase-like putative cysteine protease